MVTVSLGLVLGAGVLSNTAYPAPSLAARGLSRRGVCSRPSKAAASCHAQIITRLSDNKPMAATTYGSGYGPGDLQSAYALPAAAGGTFAWNGQTVAVVDAYDNPNAAGDLLAYRKQFHLPLCPVAGSTPSAAEQIGCLFTTVNETGGQSPLPSASYGWGQEIDLDIEMASAVCPDCKVLLVEAATSSYTDLGAAENRAAAMHANAISNSYGGPEFRGETLAAYNGYYNHPGIAITVSSGDSGYGAEFPAASQYVTAVGGTSLYRDSASSRGWSESAWSSGGSGCSAYISRPTWQPAIGTCTHRIVADVSADADPGTGVAVYDSFGSNAGANWYVFGGTSVAAPIVAGVYALAGNAGGTAPAIRYGEYPYGHITGLSDVLSGSNGRCVSRRGSAANLRLCTAAGGFDGPTGLGTPNGTGAF